MGKVALAIWGEITVGRPLESLNGTEILLKERWNPPTAKEGTAGCRAREINNEPSLLLRDWIGRKSLCAEESRLNISNQDKLQQLANRLANSMLGPNGVLGDYSRQVLVQVGQCLRMCSLQLDDNPYFVTRNQ